MAEILRGASRVRWRVAALETPRVWRHCPGCNARRSFRSSDRFRVNAQQRRVDVWLVYRCESCACTWNCTVLARRSPSDIGGDLVRFERNDVALAWRFAFDRALLRRAGARADPDVAFRVDVVDGGAMQDACSVLIALAQPLEVRLDRVMATALGVGRAQLRRWVESGALHVEPDGRAALGHAARDGQRIVLAGAAAAALTASLTP
jgi:hypothetical protein